MINTPPKEGWKEHTVYLVLVQHSQNNPEHKALLHTGFINKDGFGGYCEVWQNSYDAPSDSSDLYSIKHVETLCKLE